MRVIAGILLVLLAAFTLSITGCAPTQTGPGTINVVVTSTVVEENASASGSEAEIEISDIEATVSEIKVLQGGVVQGEGSEQNEWVNLYVASRPLDLLQNSSQEQFLAFADVVATSYDEIVMVIDELNVTLSNGSNITVTPNEPFDFTASFVVYAEKTTNVIFKFRIDKSVILTDEGKTTIKPLAGITLNVEYEEIE